MGHTQSAKLGETATVARQVCTSGNSPTATRQPQFSSMIMRPNSIDSRHRCSIDGSVGPPLVPVVGSPVVSSVPPVVGSTSVVLSPAPSVVLSSVVPPPLSGPQAPVASPSPSDQILGSDIR